MNTARMAMLVTGMGFILLAGAVLYYQTDLRNNVPEGAAIAVLLLMLGLFVVGFSDEIRRSRRYEHVSHESHTARPARPIVERTYVRDTEADVGRPRRRGRVREEHVEETRIER